MLQTLKLFLPVLIPSWRFFDRIAASPRIEYTRLETPQSPPHWQEFRPRPAHLPFTAMVKHMFFNPRWNESLFLVSCAERLTERETAHSVQEIATRVKAGLMPPAPFFQFRIALIDREGQRLEKHITFVSPVYTSDGSVA
jgi:hypothetical protein